MQTCAAHVKPILLESAPRMASKNIVHVVGTGTIGEPLIGLFTDFKERWGIDEVTFHKRTPKIGRASCRERVSIRV